MTFPHILEVCKPLTDTTILLNGKCHVDHEGFDLNEIEQAYYQQAGVCFEKENTWYKDGDGMTAGVIQPWILSISDLELDGGDEIILDHSHFVFKFPIGGAAFKQIRSFVPQRRELLRLVSTNFKCGLDLCLDLFTGDASIGRVEPIVHIEWDYTNPSDMSVDAQYLIEVLQDVDWNKTLPKIKKYNEKARRKHIDAFEQADYRAELIFGDKSYKLISTL
jgi:hypothetical protein